MAIGYMLDTNVFNRALCGEVPEDAFIGRKLFSTHIQLDEIGRTKNPSRLAELGVIFETLSPTDVATTTAIWDDSNFDQANWDGGRDHDTMLLRLRDMDKLSGKKSSEELNQSRDVRIAETAIEHGLILVSDDVNLVTLTIEFGGKAISITEFSNIA